MRLSEAPTPSLVLDLARLRSNCRTMLARAGALGVGLRPHMKTLKSAEAARIAIDPGHGGIAVSTLREGEYFADAGFSDIQCALCLTPDKLERAAALLKRAPRFSFFLDSVEMARAVVDYARANGAPLRVWIEIDSGEHRTGVAPDSDALAEIARILDDPAVVLEGVATHAGHAYGAVTLDQIRTIAEAERAGVVAAAERLRGLGIEVRGVSAGSSPTAAHTDSARGLTELRAGVYMAGDVFQAAIGTLDRQDMALSVLASVISASPEQGRLLIDAGGLALSKDRSTLSNGEGDVGYGLVTDIDGHESLGELIVGGVHQEHGEIRGPATPPFERLPIGAKVRVFPNHACMTGAAHDAYWLVDGNDQIVGRWRRENGW